MTESVFETRKLQEIYDEIKKLDKKLNSMQNDINILIKGEEE